jgi:hypothetical protein
MINLAGEKNADKHILEELYLAGIKAEKVDTSKGEVPYTFIGKIGKWTFKRLWYYWSASVEDVKDGVPLKSALEFNNRKTPVDKDKILGDTVRAGGHAGGISPDDYVGKTDRAELVAECKRLGLPTTTPKSMGLGEDETDYANLNYGEIAKLCNEGKLNCERYIDVYHIDDQIGLKEFATFLND